jgi:hypothetical protein
VDFGEEVLAADEPGSRPGIFHATGPAAARLAPGVKADEGR